MDEVAVRALRWKRLLAQVAIAAAVWAAILLVAALCWAGGSVWENLRDAGWEIWLATLGMFAAGHLLRFVRWHWMLWMEGHRLRATRSLAIFMAGLALLPTPGKAGVAVRSLLLLREGVPANVSLAVYFAERLFDLLGLVTLAALFLGGESSAGRWVAALAAGIIGIVAVRLAPGGCEWLLRRCRVGSSPHSALTWARRFFVHAAELVIGRLFLPYLLLGMGANVMTGVLLWLAVSRFGAPLAAVDAVGIVAIAQLSGSLSLLPGGLGGFELAMLAQLSSAGVTAGGAVASMALVRLATIWGSVAVGLPLLLAGLRRARS